MIKKLLGFLFTKLIGNLSEEEKGKLISMFNTLLVEVAKASAKEAIKNST